MTNSVNEQSRHSPIHGAADIAADERGRETRSPPRRETHLPPIPAIHGPHQSDKHDVGSEIIEPLHALRKFALVSMRPGPEVVRGRGRRDTDHGAHFCGGDAAIEDIADAYEHVTCSHAAGIPHFDRGPEWERGDAEHQDRTRGVDRGCIEQVVGATRLELDVLNVSSDIVIHCGYARPRHGQEGVQ